MCQHIKKSVDTSSRGAYNFFMEPAELKEKRNVPDEVARAIERIIVDNDLQPGDKLPSQAELSTALGVGARSVREAIKTLEARGLIQSFHGKGFYVRHNNLDFFLEVLNDSIVFNLNTDEDILLELTCIRKMIETNVIFDIARNPDRSLLKQLIDLVADMDAAVHTGNISEYNRLDLRFHKKIVGAKKNGIIITLYKYLTNLLEKSMSKTGCMEEGLRMDGLRDHHQIVEALVGRDPQRARDIMERHILSTQHKLEHMDCE